MGNSAQANTRNGGFYIVSNRLIDEYGPRIGVFGIAVYSVIAKYSNEKGENAFPSYQTIANSLSISRRKVIDTMNLLVECGLIEKESRISEKGDPTSNNYRLINLGGSAPHALPSAQNASEVVHDIHQGSAPHAPDQYLINNTQIEENTKSAEAVAVQPEVGAEVQTPPLHVQAKALPLSKQYDALLDELRTTKNRQAVLMKIYVMCFGQDETTPTYSYLGTVANQVGGAGYLAQRFWDLSRDRPDGDILAYILKAHKNKSNGNGYNGYKQVQPGINTQKAGELER